MSAQHGHTNVEVVQGGMWGPPPDLYSQLQTQMSNVLTLGCILRAVQMSATQVKACRATHLVKHKLRQALCAFQATAVGNHAGIHRVTNEEVSQNS